MEVKNDTKATAAHPASPDEGTVGHVAAYIDPVKEAKMMRKFDVRAKVVSLCPMFLFSSDVQIVLCLYFPPMFRLFCFSFPLMFRLLWLQVLTNFETDLCSWSAWSPIHACKSR